MARSPRGAGPVGVGTQFERGLLIIDRAWLAAVSQRRPVGKRRGAEQPRRRYQTTVDGALLSDQQAKSGKMGS
jgi:hypothetical protein